MGIELSHGAWQSSYYAFWLWRRFIFETAGFGDLRTVDGYFDPEDEDDWPDGPPSDLEPRDLRDVMPKSDPLYGLFAFDDDGGTIRSSSLPPLAKRLERMLIEQPDAFSDDYRQATERFIAGAWRAHDAREDLRHEGYEDEEEPQPHVLGLKHPHRRRAAQ
jgi:hypothetical protein